MLGGRLIVEGAGHIVDKTVVVRVETERSQRL